MKIFRVYMTETIEYSYDVEAKSPEEAKEIIYEGGFDDETYQVWDSFNSQIVDVQETEDEQQTLFKNRTVRQRSAKIL